MASCTLDSAEEDEEEDIGEGNGTLSSSCFSFVLSSFRDGVSGGGSGDTES